jgi:uncharacterized GH25 family protein
MKRLARLPALMLALAAVPACAHDFWIQPSAFWSDQHVSFSLQAGHGTARRLSPIPLKRIASLEANGEVLPHAVLVEGIALAEGTTVLGLASNNSAQSHLPAALYNDYLREEGLRPALAYREAMGQMDRAGSESYSRRAKVLLQRGPVAGDVTQPLGMTLEIVPLVHPYAQSPAAILPIRVIYEGRPLAGATVRLTDLDNDAAPFETRVTAEDGTASLTMPRQGQWMIGVVWTRPLPFGSAVDFDTIFSSLSFGFSGRP